MALLHVPSTSPFFMSGVSDLFDVMCEQHNRIALTPVLNDTKNSDIDGTCKRIQNLVSIEVPRSQKFCKRVSRFLFIVVFVQLPPHWLGSVG